MNVVDCGSYCIVNINNQLYRYDYANGNNVNTVTEELIRNQGTTVKPDEALQLHMLDENQLAELGFDPDDDGLDENEGTEEQGTTVDAVDYNNWLVNNGLSGISKLSAESKIEDIRTYYEQIASKLNSIMTSIDSALASKDPDTIDAYMTELTFNMAALESVSQQSGMGSLVPDEYFAGVVLGSAVAGGAAVAATAAGATAALATVAGVSVTIPGIGWAVAGVCLAIGIGMTIHDEIKKGEIKELTEQMQQTMDDCKAKREYAQREIGEIVNDTVSEVETALNTLEEANFSDIEDMNGVFANINGVLVFQASIEKWAEICEKYGVSFGGQDLLNKLGSGDEKEKYANEYIVNFVDHTKNAIETSGNVVDDTGTYIASADEITELISALSSGELTRKVNTAPLTELIQFIQETNQQDVYDDAGAIGDGMYTGSGDYNFGGYSDAFTQAGENQTGVDGAAQNGQYEVDTSQYTEVQNEAKEAAQKDIDDYLAGLEISGKSVGELEELYNTTKADLDDFSQYQENLDLDLSGFDTAFENIRKEQQARVDEYIESVAYSGKSISELEQLYTDVSAQGEAFKQASSEVDISAFDGVLSNIRGEQQAIVDKKADELSTKLQSGSSLAQLTSLTAETDQYVSSVSGYSVSTGRLSAISDLAKEKIQAEADAKAITYETKAATVKTSDECMTLADTINIEITQFLGTGADTSGLQKVVADLTAKAILLRAEEDRKKAAEDAKKTSSTTPDTTTSTPASSDTDPAQTPVALPADDGEVPVPDGEPAEDGETTATPPATDDTGETVDTTGTVNGENTEPPVSNTEDSEDPTTSPTGEEPTETPPAGEEPTGEVPPAEGDNEPVDNGEPAGDDETLVNPPATDDGETTETQPEGSGETPPPAASDTETDSGTPNTNTETTAETFSSTQGITSVGEADETTPPPKTADVVTDVKDILSDGTLETVSDSEITQAVEDGLEEGKTPEEIADLIEIEVEE